MNNKILTIIIIIILFLTLTNYTTKAEIEHRELIPKHFPVNNTTTVTIDEENQTYWVKTKIDLNNWSISDFYNTSELLPTLPISTTEIEIWQEDLEQSRKNLEKTQKDLDELSDYKTDYSSYLILIMQIIPFLLIMIYLVIRRIKENEKM